MKRKYSVIVFDLGNVLIPFDYNIAYNKLEKVEPGLGKKFLEQYKKNYSLHRSYEKGELSENEFIAKLLGFLENKIDEETLIDAYSKIFSLNENVAALLPELKKKYILVLLSNTNSIHQKHGWNEYQFIKYFDKLILSHEVKALKPEKEIYKAVEAFTGKPPEEHIFIDDIAEYADAAKKAGWDAVQFINYEQLYKELRDRGII
jgi:putative hydrolase of the HAD superfamily